MKRLADLADVEAGAAQLRGPRGERAEIPRHRRAEVRAHAAEILAPPAVLLATVDGRGVDCLDHERAVGGQDLATRAKQGGDVLPEKRKVAHDDVIVAAGDQRVR